MDRWYDTYRSWGRVIRTRHLVSQPATRDAAADQVADGSRPSLIAYGCGRSYGDLALNNGGGLIDCTGLDRIIAFDGATGLLTAEAGVRLADILVAICRPDPDGSGWMLPVTPGTRFVTLGGAIASDVHGKNHHRAGTFGSHVLSLELARSDGQRLTCSLESNAELFAATIGGLGLTGLILSATIQMRRVPGLAVEAEEIRFDNLADCFVLASGSDAEWEYTAAWIDCLARGPQLGRGIFFRARHVPGRAVNPPAGVPRISIPIVPPLSLVTSATVRVFNAAYWRKLGPRGRTRRVGSYEGVFYPLDGIGHWNRVYGPGGFYQFQCQVPPGNAQDTIAALLSVIAESGQASMLSVLKLFGDKSSPGMLSFPAPGATLALDFGNRGASTRALLMRLEQIVVRAGGRLYAAKDALMAPATFRAGYPALARFQPHIDPRFSSNFARRVGLVSTALPEGSLGSRDDPATPTVAIFGATSGIATAVARRYAETGHRLVLVGRDATALAVLRADLAGLGAPATEVLEADFTRLETLPALATAAWERFGFLDVALLAYGTMAPQDDAEKDPAVAAAMLTLNFASPAILLDELANRFESRGRGAMAAITSVAGDRGRKSNYVYGSAKGGLQVFLEGLRHRLATGDVTVTDIRPGFVATRMTAHLDRSGPLWATPDRVAGDIIAAIAAGRAVRYTPGVWRLIMLIIRSLPRFVFHRTSF